MKKNKRFDYAAISILCSKKGEDYNKTKEFGGARRVLTGFYKWTVDKYPELTIQTISREICLEYIQSLVDTFRLNPIQKDHSFITFSIRILNETFDMDISDSETNINEPFKVMCDKCNTESVYVNSSIIYGTERGGMRYRCPVCGSHVGFMPILIRCEKKTAGQEQKHINGCCSILRIFNSVRFAILV